MAIALMSRSQEQRTSGFAMLLLIAVFSGSVRADIEVNHRKDKVVLVDGTEVECLVLMETTTGVLIVEADPADEEKTCQRIIPLEKVSKVVHGKPDGRIAGFQTETKLAHKVVQGTGFRKEESSTSKDTAAPAGPAGSWAQSPAITLGNGLSAEGSTSTSALSSKELQDAYMSRFPALKDTASALLGPDGTTQLFDQAQKGDPLVRKQLENFLGLFVKPDAQPQASVEKTAPANRQVRIMPARIATPPADSKQTLPSQ